MISQKVLLAAVALSLSFVAVFAGDVTPTGQFDSPIGQQRTVPLPDGSTITLNTDSHIRIWGSEVLPHVELLKGEALFDMKPNPLRHLIVSAYDVELVDQGTVFDVRLVTNDTVRVTVQEGSVQLSANGGAKISLRVNQQTTVVYSPTFASLRTRNVSSDAIQHQLAWRQGVLDFDCVKLVDAIKEINRYNVLQMEIVGPIVGDDRISGVGFSPTDPTLFATTAAALIPNLTSQLAPQHPGQPMALQLRQMARPTLEEATRRRCTPQDREEAVDR